MKCAICGMKRKTMIKCSSCGNDVCLDDFWCQKGLCADCINEEYNEKYKEKIEMYEELGISIGG